ncbi:hypothetical protein RRG08_059469 [Elysia crispata]|uniref:Uncharacterized protein n=1 Tax=Elysia crispata TaxID=231223 RepID=A0AAE1DSM7_9GAST|nr:hypothetical protein RRG08_059469 [Elysia crispata]
MTSLANYYKKNTHKYSECGPSLWSSDRPDDVVHIGRLKVFLHLFFSYITVLFVFTSASLKLASDTVRYGQFNYLNCDFIWLEEYVPDSCCWWGRSVDQTSPGNTTASSKSSLSRRLVT